MPVSKVWEFFEKKSDKTTKCKLCAAVLKYTGGSTSAMKNHLLHVHKKNLDKEDGKTSSLSLRQTTLKEMHQSKRELGKDMYNKLNRALALMMALDIRPLSLVEGEGFRYFCHLLNPLYKVPGRNTIKSHLKFLYDDAKQKFIAKTSGSFAAFTTDLWTSIGACGYITLTSHSISAEWKLSTEVMATRPLDVAHTGVNIAATIKEVQVEFEVTKLSGMTTDNASNMTVACREMDIIHIKCFSHSLQLAVSKALKDNDIRKTLAAASSLVTHFNHSSSATTALKEKQKSMDKDAKPLRLMQSCPTRWNSEFLMADCLIKLRLPVWLCF